MAQFTFTSQCACLRTDNIDVDDVAGLSEDVWHGDAVSAGVVRCDAVDDETSHVVATHHLHLQLHHRPVA